MCSARKRFAQVVWFSAWAGEEPICGVRISIEWVQFGLQEKKHLPEAFSRDLSDSEESNALMIIFFAVYVYDELATIKYEGWHFFVSICSNFFNFAQPVSEADQSVISIEYTNVFFTIRHVSYLPFRGSWHILLQLTFMSSSPLAPHIGYIGVFWSSCPSRWRRSWND